MTTGQALLDHYRMESLKIKEARQVFFDKGVIRRELIANELAFSWLRCKYKNVDPTDEPLNEKNQGIFLPLDQIPNRPLALNDIWVGLFDAAGKMKRYTGNKTLCQQFSNWSFNEIHAGYNGIGNCIENRILSIVIGFEHYHGSLCSTISIGIPHETESIGLIVPLESAQSESLDMLLQLPFQMLLATPYLKEPLYPLNCHFFRKDIDAFSNCYNAFKTIAETSQCLKVSAKDPQDAYLLAHEIHKNSTRAHMPFVYVSENQPISVLEQSLCHETFKGTLYIEGTTWLTRRLQDEVVGVISCKLINSKPYNSLYTSDSAFVLLESTTSDYQDSLQPLYVDLLDQMESCKLCIPSFQELGEQFKLYLCGEFEKICERYGIQGITYNEVVLNLFTQHDWLKGHLEIERMADYHLSHAKNPNYVDLDSVPECIKTAKPIPARISSLKEKEREWIIYVLRQCNGNIKQSAKLLGITRTTLYKKIEEYQIEV